MVAYLKQSTAATIILGPFLDETDGKTAEVALTISQADVRLSKNAAAFAQANEATAATHMENGYYSKPLSTTDTNTIGELFIGVAESGALPVWRDFHVLAANVYDSLFGAATDKLDVNVEEWNTTAVPPEHTAGYPIVTVKDGAGTGEINTNAGKVVGVELADVLTTYTGNTLQTGDTYALASGASGFVALKTVVDAISATIGVAGAGLTATAAAVWAVATRLLTAGTNIVLAKGTGVTGFNDIAATAIVSSGAITTSAGKVSGVILTDTTTTLTGHTAQTGDTYALANGASGFVALKAVVDAISTTIGVAGAGLTAVATAVWASATRLLTAGTNIVLAKGVGLTGLNDLSSAQTQTAAETALAAYSASTYAGGDTAGTTTLLSRVPGTVQPQTGDSFARLGAPVGASLSADLATKATPAQILTTALTEAYAADGVAPTLSQLMFLTLAALTEFSISGVTITTKKLDGISTAATYTLDSDTSPTSRTRAT